MYEHAPHAKATAILTHILPKINHLYALSQQAYGDDHDRVTASEATEALKLHIKAMQKALQSGNMGSFDAHAGAFIGQLESAFASVPSANPEVQQIAQDIQSLIR
jgi:hypothetical protein